MDTSSRFAGFVRHLRPKQCGVFDLHGDTRGLRWFAFTTCGVAPDAARQVGNGSARHVAVALTCFDASFLRQGPAPSPEPPSLHIVLGPTFRVITGERIILAVSFDEPLPESRCGNALDTRYSIQRFTATIAHPEFFNSGLPSPDILVLRLVHAYRSPHLPGVHNHSRQVTPMSQDRGHVGTCGPPQPAGTT